MYICMHVCECEFVRSFITGIATAESVCAENHKQYMYAQPCPAAQTAQPTPVLPPFFGKKLKRGLVRREKVENIEEQKKKRVFSSERRAVDSYLLSLALALIHNKLNQCWKERAVVLTNTEREDGKTDTISKSACTISSRDSTKQRISQKDPTTQSSFTSGSTLHQESVQRI